MSLEGAVGIKNPARGGAFENFEAVKIISLA